METETTDQAIEALLRDYSKLVFHVIYGLTGHWEESEDLTQETFVHFFQLILTSSLSSANKRRCASVLNRETQGKYLWYLYITSIGASRQPASAPATLQVKRQRPGQGHACLGQPVQYPRRDR